MSLHPDREELMAWQDGEVAADRAAEIAAHASSCAECRAFTASLDALSRRVSQWTVEPATFVRPTAAPIAAPSSGRVNRRMVMLAAAAVFLVAIVTTVRVECAPAPACDRHTFRLSFMPPNNSPGLPEQARAMSPAERAAFENYWLAKPDVNGKPRPPKDEIADRLYVVVFLDWQCPACRAEYRAYALVFADFSQRVGRKIIVDYKDYPLNKRCNANVPVEMHPAACEAAVAVRLAKSHGTQAAMIQWLFDNQESLTPASVRAAAATVGQIPDFAAKAPAALLDMKTMDLSLAVKLGVHSTPTCFISNVLARGENDRLLSAEEIRAAIEIELKRLK